MTKKEKAINDTIKLNENLTNGNSNDTLNSFDFTEFVTSQPRNSRAGDYEVFTSKKQLLEKCTLLNKNVIDLICRLRGVHTIDVHKNGGKFVMLGLFSVKTKNYRYMLLDTVTLKGHNVDSIRAGKSLASQLLADEKNL